ncbi:MAG: TRAP transporter substrate-binding protein DctP [Alkalispirochaeta sp.]
MRNALNVALFVVLHTAVSATLIVAEPVLLRISVENTEDHVQTVALRAFAQELSARSNERITVQLYHSGELYRDQDVMSALQRGRIEMAVPGTWHISRYVPEVALFLLPEFYGRGSEFVHRVSDGRVGSRISGQIESVLGVVIPGPWFDLGPAHLFFVDGGVRGYQDISGLVIRVAGGRGNELRIASLGAEPITVAWNDLPAYLSTGQVDGVLTTYETVRSGALWRYGISHVLEDSQYYPQYVPMIRRTFWDRLTEEDRRLLRDVWHETVPRQRAAAARGQTEARETVIREGVRIEQLITQQVDAARQRLIKRQSAMAAELGVPPELVDSLYDR